MCVWQYSLMTIVNVAYYVSIIQCENISIIVMKSNSNECVLYGVMNIIQFIQYYSVCNHWNVSQLVFDKWCTYSIYYCVIYCCNGSDVLFIVW